MKLPLSMLLSRKLRSVLRSEEKPQCVTDTERSTGVGTVMLSDIRRFTGELEKVHVEEIASVMNEFMTLLPAATYAKNGTLLNFTGDASLAYWGPSDGDSSHAKAAFTCGSEILRAVQGFQKARSPSFEIRMALGTGNMTVGMIGGKLQVVGRAVATADRLLKLDRPPRSSMLCTEETLQLIPNAVIPTQTLMQMQRTYGTAVDVYEFTEL
jgi:adenylate cyclase